MMKKRYHILVLHFGYQCPWIPWVIDQARQAVACLGGAIGIQDVTHKPELAGQYRLFFPFMTVINDELCLPSPMPASKLIQFTEESLSCTPIKPTRNRTAANADVILPLTAENILLACSLCISSDELRGCQAKASWARAISSQNGNCFLGFAAYKKRRMVCAVEFLPARLVPYPLSSKRHDIAFITCLYGTEDMYDYRGQVLEHLLDYLQMQGFQEAQVVAGKCSPYPNGPEPFFKPFGFKRATSLGLVTLAEGREELYLLKRDLK